MLRLVCSFKNHLSATAIMSLKQSQHGSKASKKKDKASGFTSVNETHMPGNTNGLRNLSTNCRTNDLKSPSSHFMPKNRRYSSSSCDKEIVSSLDDMADYIISGKAKSIVAMVGAGISTLSGIPDFRSPGTGVYDNLQEYKIPYPEAVFDIEYFRYNPKPFFTLARELYPTGKYRPNIVHYFLRLFHEKNLLLRLYTQNIDGLERLAGIPVDKVVEAHGQFLTSTCTRCRKPSPSHLVKVAIFQDKIPRCQNENCRGIVKPDIVFFGEDLPTNFYEYKEDLKKADLLLVMGTSLEVYPFAGIVDDVNDGVPRVLFNRERVGPFAQKRLRHNDVAVLGDMSENLEKLSQLLGWSEDLHRLIAHSEADFAKTEETCNGQNKEPADDIQTIAVASQPLNGCGSAEQLNTSQLSNSSSSAELTNEETDHITEKLKVTHITEDLNTMSSNDVQKKSSENT